MISPERRRGGCLTAWLMLMLILNPLVAIYYLVAGGTVRQALPGLPPWVLPVLTVFGIANFVFALAVWNWKKWGMYGFVGSSAVVFFINAATLGTGRAIIGLVGVIILAALVRPIWKQME